MFIIDYLSKNYIMLAELIGLLLLLRVSVYLHKRTLVFTRITVFLILLSSILIYVEDWTSTFETLSIWRPILTAIIYSIQPVILIIIMYITSPMRRELLLLLLIPLAAYVIWKKDGEPLEDYLPIITPEASGRICLTYFSDSTC